MARREAAGQVRLRRALFGIRGEETGEDENDLSAVGSQADHTAWWLGFPDYYDSTGHLLGNLLGPSAGQPSYVIQYFQPGDRFWAFQTIEAAILCGLALLIVGCAVYWVTRRAT